MNIRIVRRLVIVAVPVLVGMGMATGLLAQEASAEITATATVTMPPVEITAEDLDFGEVLPGEDNNVAPDPEGTARGAFTLDNIPGSRDVWVRFRNAETGGPIIQHLVHSSGAVLPLEWDDTHALGCWRNTNQPSSARTCGDTWNPENDELVMRTPQGHGRPITLEVYLGGRVVPVGDEPAGQYVGRIQVVVDLVQ